ncbi:Putative fructokinase [Gemmata sp. SH-PL17]|uniref:ROK family protein n=1 Tax=Gemmata sp. SH-PL17 TaxID=1630693 RepID=UPI00078E58FC|nr:ROK family protein [Gemmata sp. SH-PL17]AMV24748.1 Putative fructokinase [Gemmata sp. SH-PL17]
MFLGIEIGGTKLQLGLGHGDGHIPALWRGTVNPSEGGEGIRKQIITAVPELFAKANTAPGTLQGVGIGFGGPTDDTNQTVIKSHQITGWDGFPLADWVSDLVGVPAVLCNDADVAGLGEALFGAGKGMSPIFYITIGSGIGGGLIIGGQIYRGVGRGAAEIGHTQVLTTQADTEPALVTLESVASGWGIASTARAHLAHSDMWGTRLRELPLEDITAVIIANEARAGDTFAQHILGLAHWAVQQAIRQVSLLLCPRRIVIGGGVSLMGEELFFAPLRQMVAERAFPPFAGLTDIVPAALGEEVVIHGALALARQKFGG